MLNIRTILAASIALLATFSSACGSEFDDLSQSDDQFPVDTEAGSSAQPLYASVEEYAFDESMGRCDAFFLSSHNLKQGDSCDCGANRGEYKCEGKKYCSMDDVTKWCKSH
jgi:hypothetical protein